MADADDARISDETLIGRTAAGDASAFDRLIRRHQAAVYRFARAAAPDLGEAAGEMEEILRDTFLAARRSAGRYRDEPSARTWLLALTRRVLDRRYPQKGPEADAVPLRELARTAGRGFLAEDVSTVAAAFEALPPEDREILTLCDREYFTVDEAARVTGLTETAVRTRLHRARLRLLARLKEDGLEG
ncbi:MAG TPA: sigma-70 family RNA polymerase sigma factor [Thermoanaerobaculia bacterium]|nr:sigma-70 family RNA polymerase sigma factor [Thermoanaerobaculia bacterium]